MSVLPAGNSLYQVIPDLEQLLANPGAYLREGHIEIGPRRMYGLAFLFGVPGIALMMSWHLSRQPEDLERLALGIGLLVAGVVWLTWSLLMAGHRLILLPEGIEIRYRDSTVWCPW